MSGQIEKKDLLGADLIPGFNELDQAILKSLGNFNLLIKAGREAQSSGAFGPLAKGTSAEVEKTNKVLTEYEKIIRETTRLQERNAEANRGALSGLIEERQVRSRLTKEIKDELIVTGRLGDAYTKLRRERDKAARTLQNLISSERASNAELRRAQKEFDRLDGKVQRADRAIRNFRGNVGNYSSAIRPIIALTRELALAFGLFSAIQIGQEIFNTVKELDSLRLGLEQVTESQEEFNETQIFLSNLADRAGVNILAITKRYTNLRAAAKTTNLSLAQTRDIFEQIVIAGALLGRTQDDVNGALRATEQILSKGTVQAEEIRGQLGERLPGAFQILEQALGLANGELNELLEVGGVLSVDAIPALARGLENTFNTDLVGRVQTLQAAQTRLTNSFNEFISSLETGQGPLTRFFTFLFESLEKSVKFFTQLTRTKEENDAAFDEITSQQSFFDVLKSIRLESEKTKKSAADVARAYRGDFLNSFNLATSRVEQYKQEIADLNETIENQFLPKTLEQSRELSRLKDNLRTAQKQVALYKGGLDAVNQTLRKNSEELDFNSKDLEKNAAEQKKIIDFFQFYSESRSKEVVKFYKDLRDEVDVGSEKWIEYNALLKEAEESLKSLQQQREILNGNLEPIEFFEDEEDPIKGVREFLSGEPLTQALNSLSDRFRLSKEDTIKQFEEIYGRDFAKFKEFEEAKLKEFRLYEREKAELANRRLDFVDTLNETYLQLQLERIDAESERSQEAFDAVSNNKESSIQQIELAEKKRAETEKRLQEERDQAERKSFLFRQLSAVADVFLADSVARARAAATAAGIFPPVLGAITFLKLQAVIAKQTAFSLATIGAQTLPALFWRGKPLGDNYEGPGIWGELRREAKVGKDGSVEISPDGPTATHVKRDDIIYKSLPDFKRAIKNPNSEAFKRISNGVRASASKNLNVVMVKQDIETKGIERVLDKVMSKYVDRPQNISVSINNNKQRVRRL